MLTAWIIPKSKTNGDIKELIFIRKAKTKKGVKNAEKPSLLRYIKSRARTLSTTDDIYHTDG